MATVKIGSARIDENGNLSGGIAGDQKQKSTPDYSGEVSMQNFYVSSKGWNVIRPLNSDHAIAIAKAMENACNNKNIGYDQTNRLGITKHGTNSKVRTECDCSSLVRQCIIEGTGKDPGNFNTANELKTLMATKLFSQVVYKDGMALYTGDILVTKTKGHTVIVVSGENPTKKESKSKTVKYTVTASGGLWLRKEPSTSADKLACMPYTASVTSNGTIKNDWIKVTFQNKTGWASGKYLKKENQNVNI